MITMYPHVVLIPPTLISFYSNIRGRMMMLREHFSRLSMYWSIFVILKALPRKDCVRNNTEHTYDIVSEFVGGSGWGVLDWPVSFACAAIKCCNNVVICPFCCYNQTGIQRTAPSSSHEWLGPIGGLCQVLKAHKYSVGRRKYQKMK